MRRTLQSLSMAVLGCVACAQETFPGTNLPISMNPSELTAAFTPLKLKEQSSGIFGDYYASYALQFGVLGQGGNDERVRQIVEILPVSWTRNEMAEVYGQRFVVTYILEPSQESLEKFAKGMPLPTPMLKLKLMKADQIGSIEPYPELDREKYLAILAKLAEPKAPGFSASDKSVAVSNAKQVGLGLLMYLADNDEIYPYVQGTPSLEGIIEPYLRNKELWKSKNPSGEGRLRFNMCLAGAKMDDVKDPANTPMVYDPNVFPDKSILVAFADGHAKFVPTEEWTRIQKNLKLKLKRYGKPIK